MISIFDLQLKKKNQLKCITIHENLIAVIAKQLHLFDYKHFTLEIYHVPV